MKLSKQKIFLIIIISFAFLIGCSRNKSYIEDYEYGLLYTSNSGSVVSLYDKQGENLGKLTARTLGLLLGTTAIAAMIGLVVGNLFQLGVNSHLVAGEATIREVSSLVDTLRGLLPSNPISAMADGNVVAVMPHPERAVEKLLRSEDGLKFFKSFLD